MNELIKNPSPCIVKRLYDEQIDQSFKIAEEDLLRQKRVRNSIEYLGAMERDNIVFHGYDSLESNVKILVEHGISVKNPIVNKAIQLLLQTTNDDVLYTKGLSKVGKILDESAISGAKTIKASILAHAGFEYEVDVQNGINKALACFSNVCEVNDLKEICYPYKEKLVFQPNTKWPDYYDLKILAFTNSWKSEKNIYLLWKALQRLLQFDPIPNIYLKHGNQLIAPGSFLMHKFDYDLDECTDSEFCEWIIRAEYLARIGVLGKTKVDKKFHMLIANKKHLTERIGKLKSNIVAMKWGAYTGMSLEKNWRYVQNKINDVIFRILVIQKYSIK